MLREAIFYASSTEVRMADRIRFPNGVELVKWPERQVPTADTVAQAMRGLGYQVYDLQTIPGWFTRSRHSHDEPEIRGAVSGVTTFHFDDLPVTIEAGDILFLPAGIPHEVRSHNGQPFSAYKGSVSGVRRVTEIAGGKPAPAPVDPTRESP